MKKIVLLLSTVLLGIGVLSVSINSQKSKSVKPNTQTSQNRQKKTDLFINFGSGAIASYSGVYANNAYDILKHSDKEIEVKEYDFGIMVNKIGNYGNSIDYAWMYFVNGEAASVAADKYELQDGDKVEWKYQKITQ